jgi:hypothetical protein
VFRIVYQRDRGERCDFARKIADVAPDLTCSTASGRPARLLSSPNRSQKKSNSNLPNKTPSRLAAPAAEAREADA